MNNDNDIQHLKLLSIFHYVVGGLSMLFSFMPLVHVAIGIFIIISPESMSNGEELPPEFIGYLFAGMGLLFFFFGFATSACIIYSGYLLGKQKKYLFSFILACVECIFIPFGTVLGIFTIIILSKDSVKNMYDKTIG